MNSGAKGFWALVAALLCASVFFGVGAERQRRALQVGERAAILRTGTSVTMERVLDGDTLLVRTENDRTVPIRLVGIKAFESTSGKGGPGSRVGKDAVETLEDVLTDAVATVELHTDAKDAHGRYLAYLRVGDRDLGQMLLQRGLVLAYTVYPYSKMTEYAREQDGARARRKGLWRHEELVERADGLAKQWQEHAR